jgi:hypothetical protein
MMAVTMTAGKTYLGGAVRATIEAPADELWKVVADPSNHPELAGSGEPRETWLVGQGPLGVGSQFQSRQRIGLARYTSTSEVTACDEPRLLRWKTGGLTEWEFCFEPVEGGTRVVHGHRWGLSGPLRGLLAKLFRVRDRKNTRNTAGTLRNLARMAGAPEPRDVEISYDPPPMEEPA